MRDVACHREDVYWTEAAVFKRIAVLVCLILILFGVLRGVNFPNLWAYTHYLLPCADFFVKRTALGCMVESIGIRDVFRYEFFTYYCFFILALFWFFLSLKIKGAITKGEFLVVPGVLVFCAGLAPIYLANISGYLDFLGALLVLLCMSMKGFRLKFLVVALGFFFLVLVHEAIVVIFLPLAAVDLAISAWEEDQRLRRKRLWLVGGMGVSFISLALLVANSSIDPEIATGLLNLAQQKTEIPISRGVFDVFSRDIVDNRGVMLWYIDIVSHESGGFKALLSYIADFLLGALVITFLNFMMARHIYRSTLVALIISLAPLSALMLVFVAYDIGRWAAWATACSFLMYIALCSRGGAVVLRDLRTFMVFIVLFALSQLVVETPLLLPREDKPVIQSTTSYIHGILTGTGSISPSEPRY